MRTSKNFGMLLLGGLADPHRTGAACAPQLLLALAIMAILALGAGILIVVGK